LVSMYFIAQRSPVAIVLMTGLREHPTDKNNRVDGRE
jgi:hypothetical protein